MGGLFSEQGLDAVKRWLDPLFRPLIDAAYRAERRDYFKPEPVAPATPTSPCSETSTSSLLKEAMEILGQANVDMDAKSRSRTTRNSPGQTPSVAIPLKRWANRPNSRRIRPGDSLRDGGSGDACKTPP